MRSKRRTPGLLQTGLLTLLLLSLAGCGFHLKGFAQPSQALNGIFIPGGEVPDTLAGVLQEDLLNGGVIFAPDAKTARYRLQVTREKFSSRVLSLDANGKALDQEIRLQAEFRLSIPSSSGEESREEQALELVRQLSYSGSDELGQRNEADLLMNDMRHDMAAQAIRMLEARMQQQPKASAAP
ncbi:MAG: LPS assembly lipoprotein LptE [Candidatus Thiodiazotropha sp.]